MSTKLFTLINGKEVRLEPNTKILPKEQFALASTGKEIVEAVLADAEQYRLEVAKECEVIKEQAQKEGQEAGFAVFAEHLASLEENIQSIREEFEKIVLPVALSAAKKIVGREIEMSQDAIVDIVSGSLKAVAQHKKIVIYVNKKDLDSLEANRAKLRDIFESLESLVIRERNDIEPGGCIIETEAGIINAQLQNQWQALETAFKNLMKKNTTIQH